jgi:flagellar biosynthetic protein FlhB
VAGPRLGALLAKVGRDCLVSAFSLAEGGDMLVPTSAVLLLPSLKPMAFLAAAVFLVVLLFELVQTGLVFSTQALKPDFNRLNPGNNLKRLFSLRLLVETLKNIMKLTAYVVVGYLVIRGVLRSDVATATDGHSLSELMTRAGLRLLAACTLVAVFFAVVDQIISRRDFLKRMRMSKRELRREMREREGEPRLKQRRKQLHGDLVKAGKGLRNIRKADLLITNPTHYAVALRYDPAMMAAPVVVSAGMNRLAERLKQLAFVYSVPTFENRVLARELYSRCALDDVVPEHCYASVADIYNTLRRRSKAPVGSDEHA